MKSVLSSREKQVLLELAKNARLSDRELAAKLKTSQPTITRIRTRLWNEKFVDRFLILPSLEKFGLQFHAFSFVKVNHPSVIRKLVAWANENQSVVFAGEGEGLHNHQFVIESLHANYGEYHAFARLLREKFPGQLSDVSSFFMDANSISKFYHWHSVLEHHLSKLKEMPEFPQKKVGRTERLRQALEKIPNPLKPKPPALPTEEENGNGMNEK